jgi:hypothetical protein
VFLLMNTRILCLDRLDTCDDEYVCVCFTDKKRLNLFDSGRE